LTELTDGARLKLHKNRMFYCSLAGRVDCRAGDLPAPWGFNKCDFLLGKSGRVAPNESYLLPKTPYSRRRSDHAGYKV